MLQNEILTTVSDLIGTGGRPNIIVSGTDSMNESADRLAGLLPQEKMNVCRADNGAQKMKESCPAGGWQMVIIRDGGLNEPAFDMIESIRRFSGVPLLTVSDNDSEIYRIMALSKGADCCMSAADGFGSCEFSARVISMLRRYAGTAFSENTPPDGSADALTNGVLTVDRCRREVFLNGVKIRMTAIEYGILEYLAENCGSVCTVEDIYRRVWRSGTPYSVQKTVAEHIRKIRGKIGLSPHDDGCIKVVFGIGYKMERAD